MPKTDTLLNVAAHPAIIRASMSERIRHPSQHSLSYALRKSLIAFNAPD